MNGDDLGDMMQELDELGDMIQRTAARRRASVRSSSDPASLLNPTTSAARRLRVSGSPPWQSLHHTPDYHDCSLACIGCGFNT